MKVRAALRAGALANPDFRRLWVALLCSSFGDAMTTAGLALAAFTVGHHPWRVAAVLAARATPVLVLGLWAGQLSDRLDRRRLMVAMDVLRAALTLTIPFLMHTDFGFVLVVAAATSAAGRRVAHTAALRQRPVRPG
jgi:MFS family permease